MGPLFDKCTPPFIAKWNFFLISFGKNGTPLCTGSPNNFQCGSTTILLLCSWGKPEHASSTLPSYPCYTLAVLLFQTRVALYTSWRRVSTAAGSRYGLKQWWANHNNVVLANSPNKPPVIWTCCLNSSMSMLNVRLLHKVRSAVCMCRNQIQIPNPPLGTFSSPSRAQIHGPCPTWGRRGITVIFFYNSFAIMQGYRNSIANVIMHPREF